MFLTLIFLLLTLFLTLIILLFFQLSFLLYIKNSQLNIIKKQGKASKEARERYQDLSEEEKYKKQQYVWKLDKISQKMKKKT